MWDGELGIGEGKKNGGMQIPFLKYTLLLKQISQSVTSESSFFHPENSNYCHCSL
jgi:hypothetical protein